MRAMARAARAMAMAQRGKLHGKEQWLDQFTKQNKILCQHPQPTYCKEVAARGWLLIP
jgi:hypothetical protein